MLVLLITTGSINFDNVLYIIGNANFNTALKIISSIYLKIMLITIDSINFMSENCDNFLVSLTNKQKHHCNL